MVFGLSRKELGTLLLDSIIELFELDFIGENISTINTDNLISSLDNIDLLKLSPSLALPVDGSGNPSVTEAQYRQTIIDAISADSTFMGVSRWCSFSGNGDQPIELSGTVKYPVTYRSTNTPPTVLGNLVQRGKNIKEPDGVTDLIVAHKYSPWPFQSSGFNKSNSGSLPQPSITLSNFNNAIGAILIDLKPYNAILTRRRIFAKHLDNGSDPNYTYQFEPDIYYLNNWTIAQNVKLNFTTILEGINTNIPKRRLGSLR